MIIHITELDSTEKVSNGKRYVVCGIRRLGEMQNMKRVLRGEKERMRERL
jgi:hypothetical protein